MYNVKSCTFKLYNSPISRTISKPYHIKPLNEEEGKQLLLRKIFPNQLANECPNDLLPLVTKFTKKCVGWPLPLVVVGGILSRKNPEYITWDEVMQKMDWQTDGSSFMGVISTSYEDLPAALKTCFMYFGAFPEDYQINATSLIQLWIAEGFIRQEGTKLLENIAESYLEELVQRCMVKASRRSCIGKIKYCHMHDLLRNLAIRKAKENNLLMVVSKNDTKLSCGTCARRVAFHGYGDYKMIEHACTKNLRSLMNLEYVPNYNRSEMLRVLHMSKVPNTSLCATNCLEGLKAMTALKYFRLEIEWCFSPFARSFLKISPLTYMQNLQMVHTSVCRRSGQLLPSFWANKQLRHVNLTCCRWCEETPDGPPSSADLPNLLTLKGVTARQHWVAELPNFPNIQKLGVLIPRDFAWEPLINLLSNLKHLSFLSLLNKLNFQTFPDCISAFRNHKHLHSFKLTYGGWARKEVSDCTLFPPYLVKLTLNHIIFEEDPMPQLEKLPNLRVLKLCKSSIWANDGNQMICSRGGFRHLQRLVLQIEKLEEWKIEEGAIPMLNVLVLACFELQKVPHFQYLADLQEFTVYCLGGFKSRLQGENQWKIKHIPSVKIK